MLIKFVAISSACVLSLDLITQTKSACGILQIPAT